MHVEQATANDALMAPMNDALAGQVREALVNVSMTWPALARPPVCLVAGANDVLVPAWRLATQVLAFVAQQAGERLAATAFIAWLASRKMPVTSRS